MKKISLKRDNRGASLLAVLILMVVVSAIAVVITKITIVNIQDERSGARYEEKFLQCRCSYG